jgi:hypothetical protein
MSFRNIILKYHEFFEYNFAAIISTTSFAGSVTGAAVTYTGIGTTKSGEKNILDYGMIGLGSCVGGVAGVCAGLLLRPVIIPCSIVTGMVCGVAKAYDTVKDKYIN